MTIFGFALVNAAQIAAIVVALPLLVTQVIGGGASTYGVIIAATGVGEAVGAVVVSFVAVDLYDGCFLYDFSSKELHVVDLDEYRPSPFMLDAERLPGSPRFMAPEEFVRGSSIEERTMVHDLGRSAFVMLDAGEDPAGWRFGPASCGGPSRHCAGTE